MPFDSNPIHSLVVVRWVLCLLLCMGSVANAQSESDSATYVRYMRPGQCVALGNRLMRQYWRDKRADTVRYAPETDSVPVSVRRAIGACAARFHVATTASRELVDLLQLNLWLGNVDAVRSTETAVVAADEKRPAVERGWTLYRVFGAYLGAKPTHMTDAVRILAQLDAMAVPAAPWRVLAHTEMALYDMSVNKGASAIDEGQAAIVANRSMARNDRVDRVGDVWESWRGLAEAISTQSDGPAALTLLDTAARELVPLLGAPAVGYMLDSGRAQRGIQKAIANERPAYEAMGTMPTPINASHWIDGRGDSTARPKSGAVTLVVFVSPNCGGLCFPRYATLHRLYDKYRPMGLQVVLLGKTRGAFKGHYFPHPASEVTQIDRYVFEFLKLPGVLGALETKFSFIADGRRSDEVWPSQYAYLRDRNCAIVGKDGVIKAVTDIGPGRERTLDAQLAAMFGR